MGFYWGVAGWCSGDVAVPVGCRGLQAGAQTRPSKPWIPHFLPAIRQPKVRASCRVLPGGGVRGEPWPCQTEPRPCQVCLCPPSASAKMTAALKVSPAPSVSTRVSGGKASECTSCPSGPRASAPSSAQAQISVALGECQLGLGLTVCPPGPSEAPQPYPGRMRPRSPCTASAAERYPKCWARSLLMNTCGRRAGAGGGPRDPHPAGIRPVLWWHPQAALDHTPATPSDPKCGPQSRLLPQIQTPSPGPDPPDQD